MLNFWQQLKQRPILALAPMAGVTDLPFRLICKEFGVDVLYTEMIMVQSIIRQNPNALRLAEIKPQEQPVVMQFGGKEPAYFKQAAQLAKQLGAAGIDINMGCPAKKIAGHGSGVALLRDLNLARAIIEATLDGADGLPVSIKTRTTIKLKDSRQANSSLDLLEKISDLPIAAVMVHGRNFESPWSDQVDYAFIRQVKERFSGIVLANGGIYEPEIAKTALAVSNADGLGIGHGVYGRPWLFQEIRDYLSVGHYTPKTWPERRTVALRHLRLAQSIKGDIGLPEFKKQLLWYIKGLPGAADYREKMSKINSLAEFEAALNDFQ